MSDFESCDVLIVGGGPAGSTCAARLVQAGLNVLVVDKCAFPRDKICAGWITPQVIQALQLDVPAYAADHVFQPITGFQIGLLGARTVTVRFDQPVSFGIRRCEFDNYLLGRSGAPCRLGEPVTCIERTGEGWVVNGRWRAAMLVGAGGHFCPVARQLRQQSGYDPPLVTAVEVEFPCEAFPCGTGTDGHVPQLYFWPELDGYGWCVQKGAYLNVGIGLVDSRKTSAQVPTLLEELRRRGALVGDLPARFHGHAYHLYDGCRSPVVDEGVLLIGDAAGLAYPQSGEGIRPAIESGLLAAHTILAAQGTYTREALLPYRDLLRDRFGRRRASRRAGWLRWIPPSVRRALIGRLISHPWFAREVIIRRWFLHADQPALVK